VQTSLTIVRWAATGPPIFVHSTTSLGVTL
jgi:hypothetical protein